MTLDNLSSLLDEVAPPHPFDPDWSGVVRRADRARPPRFRGRGRGRQLRLVVAFAAIVAVVAPLAVLGASEQWWFLGAHVPPPVSSPAVVHSGNWGGHAWDLVAYRSGKGVCFMIQPSNASTDGGLGAAMGCGGFEPSAPLNSGEGESRRITYLMGPGGAELPPYIAGPVVELASQVDVELASGETDKAEIFDAPPSLGTLKFYALTIPGGTSVVERVLGRDTHGDIVACVTVAPDASCPA
jgi:hypothetical protein